jgi:DNA-directed RNA polymerase specialized sigma24 family protein
MSSASDASGGRPADAIGLEGIDALYRALARRVQQIVRGGVDAPEVVIEDACAFAWSRLAFRAAHVRREAALRWLVATAVHEACRLVRREGRELSLELLIEERGEGVVAGTRVCVGADEVLARREKIGLASQLPDRQRRLLWLHSLGLSYAETAAAAGCTPRTVERQLLRARRTMRTLAATEP